MNIWKVSTFVLGAVVAAGAVYATATPASAEPQPNMQAALTLLRGAKGHLEIATADKGGHRVKAIELTNRAIEEVQLGVQFDNKH